MRELIYREEAKEYVSQAMFDDESPYDCLDDVPAAEDAISKNALLVDLLMLQRRLRNDPSMTAAVEVLSIVMRHVQAMTEDERRDNKKEP